MPKEVGQRNGRRICNNDGEEGREGRRGKRRRRRKRIRMREAHLISVSWFGLV